jgi:hypothetical protein
MVATTVALAHRAHPPYLDLVGLRNDETRSILNHKIIHDVASMSRRWVLRARNWVLSKWGFLVFEDSMLGLLPQAALLLLAPLRLATLRRRRQRVARDSHLGFLKMVRHEVMIQNKLDANWCQVHEWLLCYFVDSATNHLE